MGHAQWAHDVLATTAHWQLRSVCPLVSTLFCQLHWNHPSDIQDCATLFGEDQQAAGEFILSMREENTEQLMIV